tara:strand:- start:537 stop:1367 length:831 start_codon:yes stop_codon:yes gene_type:complete
MKLRNILITLISFFSLLKIDYAKSADDQILRIVSLNSLSADIVSKLDNNTLIGIPGSSLLKKNNYLKDKVVVSSGRMPPSIEKIIELKPDLVIGSKGFHDKILSKLNQLNIRTLETETKSIKNLETLIEKLSKTLNKDKNILLSQIKDCYKLPTKTKGTAVVLASTKPLLSPNSQSWAGSLLDRYKFNNITNDFKSNTQFKGYINLSPEILIKNKPSNLFVITFPGMSQSNSKIPKNLESIILKNKTKIHSFNYYGFINPGSLQTINQACRKLSSI